MEEDDEPLVWNKDVRPEDEPFLHRLFLEENRRRARVVREREGAAKRGRPQVRINRSDVNMNVPELHDSAEAIFLALGMPPSQRHGHLPEGQSVTGSMADEDWWSTRAERLSDVVSDRRSQYVMQSAPQLRHLLPKYERVDEEERQRNKGKYSTEGYTAEDSKSVRLEPMFSLAIDGKRTLPTSVSFGKTPRPHAIYDNEPHPAFVLEPEQMPEEYMGNAAIFKDALKRAHRSSHADHVGASMSRRAYQQSQYFGDDEPEPYLPQAAAAGARARAQSLTFETAEAARARTRTPARSRTVKRSESSEWSPGEVVEGFVNRPPSEYRSESVRQSNVHREPSARAAGKKATAATSRRTITNIDDDTPLIYHLPESKRNAVLKAAKAAAGVRGGAGNLSDMLPPTYPLAEREITPTRLPTPPQEGQPQESQLEEIFIQSSAESEEPLAVVAPVAVETSVAETKKRVISKESLSVDREQFDRVYNAAKAAMRDLETIKSYLDAGNFVQTRLPNPKHFEVTFRKL